MSPQSGSQSNILPIAIMAVLIGTALGGGGVYLFGPKESTAQKDQILANVESAQLQASSLEMKTPDSPVLARVDGNPVTENDIARFLEGQGVTQDNPAYAEMKPLALEQVIRGQIVINEAQKAGLETDSEVLEQLDAAKKHIINTTFLQRTVDGQITDQRINEEYEAYTSNMPLVEERRARHILVEDEKTAKDIIKKIGTKPFEELAAEFSIGPTKTNGGDLGYFTEDQMVPAFAEAAYAMDKGATSQFPVKTQFGYHVIKVEDIRQKPAPTFEELEPTLRIQLRQEILNDLINGWEQQAEIERTQPSPAAGAPEQN